MVNCWCKDLHLRWSWKSKKRHYSLSLLLPYQINVILTICGYWLSKNLEKIRKLISLADCKLKYFSSRIYAALTEYRPIKFVLCPFICPVFIWKGSIIGSVQCYYILGHVSVSIWSGTSNFYILGDLMFLFGQEQADFYILYNFYRKVCSTGIGPKTVKTLWKILWENPPQSLSPSQT